MQQQKPQDMTRNQKLKVSRIIDLIIRSNRPLTSQQIAEALALDASTTNRLLNSMADDGLIHKDRKSRTFHPSASSLFPLPLFHPLNTSAEKIWATVLQLRNEWSLTSGFVYFYGDDRVLAALAMGVDPLTSQYNTVLTSPIHASGSGKLLLASKPEQRWKSLLGPTPLRQFTPKTTTDLKTLQKEIKAALKTGFLVCQDDYVEGFSVVSSPVFLRQKIIGCFFISGRSDNLNGKGITEIGQSLQKSASLFELSNPAISQFESLFI